MAARVIGRNGARAGGRGGRTLANVSLVERESCERDARDRPAGACAMTHTVRRAARFGSWGSALRGGTAVALAVAAFASAPGRAAAEPSEADRAAARELDAEAERLLREERYEEALERYEESAKLVDVPAHWLMIARVRARLGRLAGAAQAYERAAAFEIPEGAAHDAKRRAVEQARAELERLRPRVPTIEVHVVGADSADETAHAAVVIDGRRIALGAPIPLDPGPHEIVARAPGSRGAKIRRTLHEGQHLVVQLELATLAPDPPPAPAPAAAETPSPEPPGRLPAWPAYVAFGVAGTAVAIGATTGAMTLARASTLGERCPQKTDCAPSDQPLIDEANALGAASTAAFVVAGAALAGGIVYVVARPRAEPSRPAARVEPWIAPGSAGLRAHF